MIATLIASQISKKRRNLQKTEKNLIDHNEDLKSTTNTRRANFAKKNNNKIDFNNIDKISLIKRYLSLLKTTMLSFLCSTLIHVGLVSSYYYTYLWLHPDDPGKKKFYSATTVSPGVNIGGRMIGGGAIQTNHHKSYFLHLVREHYKSLSKLFFFEFSGLYLLCLYLFKFFPERSKLKEDTEAAFNLENLKNSLVNQNNEPKQSSSKLSSKTKTRNISKKRVNIKSRKRLINRNDDDEYEDIGEDSESGEEMSNEIIDHEKCE